MQRRFVAVSLGLLVAIAGGALAKEIALKGDEAKAFVSSVLEATPGEGNARSRFVDASPAASFAGTKGSRFQQLVDGVEVFDAQVYAEDGFVTGTYYTAEELEARNSPKLSAGVAVRAAVERHPSRSPDGFAPMAKLYFDAPIGLFVYRVELAMRYVVWVDAESSEIVHEVSDLPTLVSKKTEAEFAARAAERKGQDQPAPEAKRGALSPGFGINHLGEVVDITGAETMDAGTWKLGRVGSQVTHDFANRAGHPIFGLDETEFFRLVNRGSFGDIFEDDDNTWDLVGRQSPAQDAAVSVAWYTEQVLSYTQDAFGVDYLSLLRNAIVRSMVHVGTQFFNAFYMGDATMSYGDGYFGESHEVVGADVIAHELGHGITDVTSGLVYENQSGALNEAFSDIFCVWYEIYVGATTEESYLIGEDVMLVSFYESGILALRDMSNPLNTGDPSHFTTRYTGNEDNGGVHINSNIINHFFYLLIEGGKNADPEVATADGVTSTMPLEEASSYILRTMARLPRRASFCTFYRNAMAGAEEQYEDALSQAFNEIGLNSERCGN